MASRFECEVRFSIPDIKSHRKKLEDLGGKIRYGYEFTDYYFKPRKGSWNSTKKNIRIRHWASPANPTTVYFVKYEIVDIGGVQFKRGVYPEGKVRLFSEDLAVCRSLLDDLGFVAWFEVRKERAEFWDVRKHGFSTVFEYIDGIGWSGELEFEGEDVQKAKNSIEKALLILDIPEGRVSHEPISATVAKARGIWQPSR